MLVELKPNDGVFFLFFSAERMGVNLAAALVRKTTFLGRKFELFDE
jgi:hypothetical protein